ncbi:MAG: AMP-binding protein, partial [Deferribacterota bacterium]|nr:AMP-binding protein [Deferribacterota bacterium]
KDKIYVNKASSAGEPLNPEVIEWFKDNWGVTIHDHYGQTEIGMVINNHHHPLLRKDIKIGSMGHSMPGFRMTIVDNSGDELKTFKEGHLAVDIKYSPLMWFQGYFKESEKNSDKFINNNNYYLTGDKVSYDNEGYFYFSGRSDDIILSAGYRISPVEIENVIMKHESVAEVAVVGIADQLKGETIKAYIVLKKEVKPTEELAEDIKSFVKSHLAAHQYPRQIEFVEYLPKTPSGKIQRFMLKNKDS